MKRNIYIVMFFLAFSHIAFTACNGEKKASQKPVVSVSVLPQKYFIDQLAGNWLDVNVMIPPGAGHSMYEPTPKQMTELAHSLVYFAIGPLDFELAWISRFKSANPEMELVNTTRNLDLLEEEVSCSEHHGEGQEHHHSAVNPHTWLSPRMAKAMVQNMAEVLIELYPQHKDSIANNLTRFERLCDSLDEELKTSFDSLENKSFIVYHPVWSYMARDYGLTQVALEHNGKEASPAQLKIVVDVAREKNIHTIFIQQEYSTAQAQAVADEIKGKVVVMSPMDYNWEQTIKHFARVLIEANNYK